MIRWLPRWRTAVNPFCSRIRQISKPDRTRSLPNRYLDLSYKDFVVKTFGDFGGGSRFEEQRESFDEIRSRFFNGCTLTRNVEFRTQRHKTIVFAFDNRS